MDINERIKRRHYWFFEMYNGGYTVKYLSIEEARRIPCVKRIGIPCGVTIRPGDIKAALKRHGPT